MTDTRDKTGTVKRDLHSARPLWADSARISPRTRSWPETREADVVIVGSGISGALMAVALADGKRRVVVVERREPVRGSTLASTAMIQHEIDVPLHELAGDIGEDKARRAWRRSAESVEALARLVEALGLKCGFERKQTLYLAGDAYGQRAFKTEAEMRTKAGLDAELLDAATLRERFGIERTAAIVSSSSASADPARLTAELLRAAQAKGAVIVSPVEITDVMPLGGGVALATKDGRLMAAGHAVFCTGYEFLDRLASRQHRVISTWALASRPGLALPDWLEDTIVWEGSDPYLYFRTTSDGRLVAGGEDEDDPLAHEDPRKLARNIATIALKLKTVLGVDIGKPDYTWAAPFGNTTTGLPLIGQVPGLANVHAVLGFGGNGITFSQIAAEIVSAAIAGRPDKDADLFRLPG